MVSITSRLAFQKLLESGSLGKMQLVALAAFVEQGPMTGSELDARCAVPNEMDPAYSRRISELREYGLLVEDGIRPCRITGNPAMAWKVVDRPPEKLVRRKKPSRPKPAVMRRILEKLSKIDDPDIRALAEWLRG